MTLLALMRHAETAWSVERRIQGRNEIPILGGVSIRLPDACNGMRIVTSPLTRCVQTAALLGAPDALREPRLSEMDWGEWEGDTLPGLRARFGEAMAANEARGLDFTPPGGESPRMVLGRLKGWLLEVARTGRPTLAITHRGVIRAILAEATGWDMTGKPPARLDWSAVHFFEVDYDGKLGVHRLNVR